MQTQIANLWLFLNGRMTNWRGERMVYKMKKKRVRQADGDEITWDIYLSI